MSLKEFLATHNFFIFYESLFVNHQNATQIANCEQLIQLIVNSNPVKYLMSRNSERSLKNETPFES